MKYDMLLAALPLVDFKYQRQMAAAIKFMELKNILRHYDDVAAHAKVDSNWRFNVMRALMPQMNSDNQKAMGQMIQMMEMQSLMHNMQNMEKMEE